ETCRSKGFGFVVMPDSTGAQKAIDALNDVDIGGRKMKVNEARPRAEGGAGGGGGFGGGGGREGGRERRW
ncbi:MAG: RNA-binding protein, partial [bacterium]